MEMALGDGSGSGTDIGALLLSLNTLLILQRKGILTDVEAREIVEQALLNLETHEKLASPQSQSAIRNARQTLESIRARL